MTEGRRSGVLQPLDSAGRGALAWTVLLVARRETAHAATRSVSAWTAHMGTLPSALGLLTAIATSPQNITAGPFMAAIPTPPSTVWGAAYSYAINAALGTFTISAAGDGATVSAP